MKTINLKYCLIALSLTAMVSMTACSSASDQVTPTENTSDHSKLIMTLATASSRADISSVDGTSSENYLSGLRVFFCDTSDKILYVVTSYDNINNPSSVVVALNNENIPVGTYHIYIGANLSESAKSQLVAGTNILTAMGTISDINDITADKKFTMFGQALNGSSSDITFSSGNTSTAAVTLNRVMAKILLTAVTDANGLIANNDADIKVADIKFAVLNTNSKYFFNQKLNGTAVIDPNYEMDTYMGNVSDFLNRNVDTSTAYKTAQSYDDSKLSSNDAGYVSNSIYCLENTTDVSSGFSSWTSILQHTNPMLVATHVRISLLATPKYIDGGKAFSTVTLTDNAYYTYLRASGAEKTLCFSSEANLRAHFGESINSDYIQKFVTTDPFVYDVFVNGNDFDASASGVLRNHYYVMKISSISTPYVSKTMELNTKVTSWATKGSTNQTIDTSGTTN